MNNLFLVDDPSKGEWVYFIEDPTEGELVAVTYNPKQAIYAYAVSDKSKGKWVATKPSFPLHLCDYQSRDRVGMTSDELVDTDFSITVECIDEQEISVLIHFWESHGCYTGTFVEEFNHAIVACSLDSALECLRDLDLLYTLGWGVLNGHPKIGAAASSIFISNYNDYITEHEFVDRLHRNINLLKSKGVQILHKNYPRIK